MPARKISGDFVRDLKDLARSVTDEAADIVESHISNNILAGGKDLTELRDAGYPLSASDFRPESAGLDKPYQIIEQQGGLRAFLGQDDIITRDGITFQTFVGFENTGMHSGTYRPFGDPTARPRRRTVPIDRLLDWLINGTARLVGRPFIINSLGDAVPDLMKMLEEKGLRRNTPGPPTIPRKSVVTR